MNARRVIADIEADDARAAGKVKGLFGVER
jgi:hypothetical protein